MARAASLRGELINHWELWRIAKKQRLVCPLTGYKLSLQNISLDHKIPLGRGGTNKPDNLQFVSYHANLAKHHLLDKEFITLCHIIAKFNPIDSISENIIEVKSGHKIKY